MSIAVHLTDRASLQQMATSFLDAATAERRACRHDVARADCVRCARAMYLREAASRFGSLSLLADADEPSAPRGEP